MLVYLFTDEIKKSITSTLGVSNEFFVFIALIVLAIVGLVSSLIVIVYGKLDRTELIQTHDISVIVNHFDPKFSHVEALLFYPPKHRWHKIRVLQKHWWEIWKQIPRHKLALVKDLKKAYYVGSYVWNLIVEGKIEWISEEDQDLDQWCEKNGYTPIHEVADEDKLLEPYFEAEIVNKKTRYMRGEAVFFMTYYRGKLTDGFFDNQITPSSGVTLLKGGSSYWSWAPDTLPNPIGEGKLDGYVNHTSRWDWQIPLNAPVGKYRIIMGVHNHFDINTRPRVAHNEEAITIVSRSGKMEKLEVSQNEQFTKEKSPVVETKTELLQTLHFFPEHWETYKKLLEKNKLVSPQSDEIKQCSDKIKSAIARVRLLNLNKINAIIPQIEAISNDMAQFGVNVQQLPRNIAITFFGDTRVIPNLVSRGDVICEKVKQTISVVEQAFE